MPDEQIQWQRQIATEGLEITGGRLRSLFDLGREKKKKHHALFSAVHRLVTCWMYFSEVYRWRISRQRKHCSEDESGRSVLLAGASECLRSSSISFSNIGQWVFKGQDRQICLVNNRYAWVVVIVASAVDISTSHNLFHRLLRWRNTQWTLFLDYLERWAKEH